MRRMRFQALELAHDRKQILESMSDGFIALDANGNVIYLNRAAAHLMHHPASDITGRSLWDEMPAWRGTLAEGKFREAWRERIPVRFEFRATPASEWLEFRINPSEKGGLTASFTDITARKSAELRLRETLAERDDALRNVRLFSGLLPICAECKKIRDQKGDWRQLESYISEHSQAKFSHGLCPECAKRYLSAKE
jgi:PAS domain S-box-containing protein